MKTLRWSELDATAQKLALTRPTRAHSETVAAQVRNLIFRVRSEGDAALRALTQQFDGALLEQLAVSQAELNTASESLPLALKEAIDQAWQRITAFHQAGAPLEFQLETAPGVVCERILRAIDNVGLYVPAGSAPLPSTALMLGVPAQVAGCKNVVLCSPPRADGSVDPAVLYAAQRCGISQIFKLGGVQAIAAMAYGTESVPKCDKLFGPGNTWVTQAKREVALDTQGAAIDMPAGPSEVLVIADAQGDAEFIAADLLSQAEHGPDSQVVFITDDELVLQLVQIAIEAQLQKLSRRDIASKALANSVCILVDQIETAVDISNSYAPEHLILAVAEARKHLPQVRSAGSVFMGNYTPEAVGDYCSGTNHVLPTDGAARAYSGVSVQSFLKQITVQELSAQGIANIGECAMTLARWEGLDAHENAVRIRVEKLVEALL